MGGVESLHDYLIRNGRVVDGAGGPWYRADIAIRDGRILEVRPRIDARAGIVIDARDQVVSPGIIDIHSHTDRTIMDNPRAETAVKQGITTQAVGTCGLSPAPSRDGWRSFRDFFTELRSRIGINLAPFVGHSAIRRYVMGEEGSGGERPVPDNEELDLMTDFAREARLDGCFGLTTGLQYPVGRNARASEIVDLLNAASPAVYMTHLRDQQDQIMCALAEAVEITRSSLNSRTVISHLKLTRQQWGWSGRALELIGKARSEGLDVFCDVYPWKYSGIGLLHESVLPPWVYEDGIPAMIKTLETEAGRQRIRHNIETGLPEWTNSASMRGWGNHTIVYSFQGDLLDRSIGDIADHANKDPVDVVCDLVVSDRGLTRACNNTMDEDDLVAILKSPLSVISTDSTAVDGLPESVVHPRDVGTYPRLLGHYVAKRGIMSVEEAIRKCTSGPAGILGLSDRGLVRPGFWADLLVFDPSSIEYPGSYFDPRHSPRGIEMVMVNGQVVVDNGEHTGTLPGHVLRSRS